MWNKITLQLNFNLWTFTQDAANTVSVILLTLSVSKKSSSQADMLLYDWGFD